jgi:hypothetical protein
MVGINMNPVQHEDASSLLASDEALFCGWYKEQLFCPPWWFDASESKITPHTVDDGYYLDEPSLALPIDP